MTVVLLQLKTVGWFRKRSDRGICVVTLVAMSALLFNLMKGGGTSVGAQADRN